MQGHHAVEGPRRTRLCENTRRPRHERSPSVGHAVRPAAREHPRSFVARPTPDRAVLAHLDTHVHERRRHTLGWTETIVSGIPRFVTPERSANSLAVTRCLSAPASRCHPYRRTVLRRGARRRRLRVLCALPVRCASEELYISFRLALCCRVNIFYLYLFLHARVHNHYRRAQMCSSCIPPSDLGPCESSENRDVHGI